MRSGLNLLLHRCGPAIARESATDDRDLVCGGFLGCGLSWDSITKLVSIRLVNMPLSVCITMEQTGFSFAGLRELGSIGALVVTIGAIINGETLRLLLVVVLKCYSCLLGQELLMQGELLWIKDFEGVLAGRAAFCADNRRVLLEVHCRLCNRAVHIRQLAHLALAHIVITEPARAVVDLDCIE